MKKHSLDLFVHKVNKRGQIARTQPYRLFIDKGVRKFEIPSGSGLFFYEDGTQVESSKKKISVPKMEEKSDLEKEILG